MGIQCRFCGNDSDYASVAQAAEILGVQKRRVMQLIGEGRLEGTTKVWLGRMEMHRIPLSVLAPIAAFYQRKHAS